MGVCIGTGGCRGLRVMVMVVVGEGRAAADVKGPRCSWRGPDLA
jgi:hypothetical protein